jgi:murein DD-endopeptidase MepM/ murein hydrolase activator NlpD
MSKNSVIAVSASVFLLIGFGFMGIAHGPSGNGLLGRGTASFGLSDTATTLGTAVAQTAAFSAPIVAESPELVLVSNVGVRANVPPVTVTPQVLGTIIGGIDTSVSPEVFSYGVESGDTISSVSEKFGVSVETILWANDLSSSATLKPGSELIVLPVTGTLHLVRENDTLSEIALWYKGNMDEIVEYNSLASAQDVYSGDFIIIPNGVKPKTVPSGRLTPVANSYFIYPIPAPHRITQGLHAYNAIDFTNGECGEPVYAAAGGTVQRTGYQPKGGNYVRLLHPNGVVTYYGHFAKILVSAGNKVFQGQTIGYTGHSGYTIPAGPGGCHVHFEVRGAENPFR